MERKWYMLNEELFTTIDWSKTLKSAEEVYWNVDNTQFIFAVDRSSDYLIDELNYDDLYIAGILRDVYWKEIIL
jgi:hypothetical protein